MADRPIIFSAPMVRALLDGRKTQTRRVLPNQPPEPATFQGWDISGNRRFAHFWHDLGDGCIEVHGSRLPAWSGDRLWVRETWRVGAWDWNNDQIAVDYCDGPRKEWLSVYDGDMLNRLVDQSREDAKKARAPLRHSYYEYTWPPGKSPCRWRPSIHMPRWASRLTLTVTDVRVQRLQEISEADAVAEGLATVTKDGNLWKWGIADLDGLPGNDDYGWQWREWEVDPRAAFNRLWNSLHGPDAWAANPWVAAISFDVHRCNIDEMPEGAW